jgi:hypothetical protein
MRSTLPMPKERSLLESAALPLDNCDACYLIDNVSINKVFAFSSKMAKNSDNR